MNRVWTKRLSMGALLLAGYAPAQEVESLCARVQMEIRQELSLERQGFDALMRINNGLPTLPIEAVDVDVLITDGDGNPVTTTSDPNSTNALFFVAPAEMTGVDDIGGSGTVAPQSSAGLRWLIIPAPGAGGTSPQGRRYLVGARFAYTLSGEELSMDVDPDTIYVKPMPRLKLDYFLPGDVYADDPFTGPTEPPVPFALGVRVANRGFGSARALAIDSGQPAITDNQLGLLVAFRITGSEVNGRAAPASFLASFGDIAAGRAGVARWVMESTLSGSFTNFEADFSHSDELGGELTSLIEEVASHELVRDILVDLPGRDVVRDFLGRDGGALKAYESDNVDTPVSDRSGSSTLALLSVNGSQVRYELTAPATLLPFYVRKVWSNSSDAVIQSVTRADGKRLNAANYWISKWRSAPTNAFLYYFNLFDSDVGGTYTLVTSDTNAVNVAPVLAPIGLRATRVGELLAFGVSAMDPNGSIPQLSLTPLPGGASFADSGTGTAAFAWTPTAGQYGVHPVRVRAADAALHDDEVVKLYVGQPGEPFTGQGLPSSLTNWAPAIIEVFADSASGVATVRWASAATVPYDVYFSDGPVSNGMTWSALTSAVEAAGSEQDVLDRTLGTNRMARFYEVRLNGDTPGRPGAWGVIRRDLPSASYTLASAPLRMDRHFDGALGAALATRLVGHDGGAGDALGDEVYILETNGMWRILYLDTAGLWREPNGSPSSYELPPGRGFIIARQHPAGTRLTFTGEVGNDGTQTNTVTAGWNLLGLSEGLVRGVTSTFDGASGGGPFGGSSEERADLVAIQRVDGSWQRLMRAEGWGAPYDGRWVDLDTGAPADPQLFPGQAIYYFRQATGGVMRVSF